MNSRQSNLSIFATRIYNLNLLFVVIIKSYIRYKVQESRLRWLGHVVRRDDEYVGKRISRMQVGRKERGRPRRRWEDCAKEDMKERGISESEAWDRCEWRRTIRTGDPNQIGI